jgi:hypothetical protein
VSPRLPTLRLALSTLLQHSSFMSVSAGAGPLVAGFLFLVLPALANYGSAAGLLKHSLEP